MKPLVSAYLEERLVGKGGEEAWSLAMSAWSKQEPRNESETLGGGDGVREKWVEAEVCYRRDTDL